MEKTGAENILDTQTRIVDSFLIDTKTKEYLRSIIIKNPEITKFVEEYFDIYTPYEQCVLGEVNPQIQQIISQGRSYIEAMERKEEKEEIRIATELLQYA